MELSQQQQEAIATVVSKANSGQRIISITGPAGSGKTTLINELRKEFTDVEVCTPTNKAAQVLNVKGIPAATFFKVFFTLEEKKQRGVRLRFLPNYQLYAGREHLCPEGKRIGCNVLIIDEASMVTSRMLYQMQQMATTIILVGDHNQLPPVGDNEYPHGYFSELEHDVVLTEIHRQGEGSLVLQLATEVRAGSPKVDRMVRFFQPDEAFEEWIKGKGAQVIAFTNKERRRINHVARKILGFTAAHPMAGDRVIVANNYSEDLINGTTGTVRAFEWNGTDHTALVTLDIGSGVYTVRMDMNNFYDDQITSQQRRMDGLMPRPVGDETEYLELQFSYCITAHKSQGSEWEAVAVIDQRGLVRKVAMSDQRSGMSPDEYVRRWTYTSVTRAKKDLAIMPGWWAQSYAGVGQEEEAA